MVPRGVSVLYGHFEVKTDDDFRFFASFDSPLIGNRQKDELFACRAIVDSALGLRWKQCFCDNRIAYMLQIGWEQHLFFNQNRFEDIVRLDVRFPSRSDVKNPQKSRGDLCLQGLVVSSRIDF